MVVGVTSGYAYNDHGYGVGILSMGDGAPRHDISNNTIDANRYSHAIWSSYADVYENEMFSSDGNYHYAMISDGAGVVEHNVISGYRYGLDCYSSSNEIIDNTIEIERVGVHANGVSGDYVIEGNTFNKTTTSDNWFVYLTNAASVTMENNEFTSLGGPGFYFNKRV